MLGELNFNFVLIYQNSSRKGVVKRKRKKKTKWRGKDGEVKEKAENVFKTAFV